MKKLGLVLSGGGGKGSYEIGVWRYLKEIGLDKKISVISGTSVGGLNAALMGTEDYENAECIWKYKINREVILTPHDDKMKKIATVGVSAVDGATLGFHAGQAIGVMAEGLNCIVPGLGVAAHAAIVTASTAAGGVLSTVNQAVTDGFFSREGLLEIFKHVKLDKIADSKKSIYVTCTLEKPVVDKVLLGDERERISFRLNNYNAEGIKKLLLATSAIPGVFRPEIIEGNKYYDGGFKAFFKNGKIISYMDNVPLTPAADEHCTHVIVVYLEPNPNKAIIRDDYGYMALRKNSIEMIEIKPSKDLGGILDGTLNFDKEAAQRNIELGYSDAKNKYGKILEKLLKEFSDITEVKQNPIETILKKYIYDMTGFNKEPVYTKEELPAVEAEVKALIKESSYEINFSDVIGYISSRKMIITRDGLLFKNENAFYYVLYDEIEKIEVPVAQGRAKLGEGVELSLSGKFSKFPETNIIIKNNFLVPSYNSTAVNKFLNEVVKSKKNDLDSDEKKEAIRKIIIEYIKKSSDKLMNFVLINDNPSLLKKVERSLSSCDSNLGINDILAYKDLSLFGNGADFFILTEEGIHYKSSGQDYCYIEYENIMEIMCNKTVTILDKRMITTGFIDIPKYLDLDYLNDKTSLYECLEKIKQLF